MERRGRRRRARSSRNRLARNRLAPAAAIAVLVSSPILSGCAGPPATRGAAEASESGGATPGAEGATRRSESVPARDANEVLLEKLRPALEAQEREREREKAMARDAGAPPGDSSAAAPGGETTRRPAISRLAPPVDREVPPDDERELSAEELSVVAASREFAKELVAAFRSGEEDEVRKLFLDEEELAGLVNPQGHGVALLASSYSGSRSKVRALLEAFSGASEWSYDWEPGRLYSTPTRQSFWTKSVPMLKYGVLTIVVDGAPLVVRPDPLIWTGERWKVLVIE